MTDTPIREFWNWWLSRKDQFNAAMSSGTIIDHVDELTDAVHRVDDRLAWELAPGEISDHQLIVTAEGDPDVRPLARRLVAAAPEADAAWSYSDMRPPRDLGGGLLIGDRELIYGEATFVFQPNPHSMDITIHHPMLAELPAEDQVQVVFLILDAAIGERATELWIDDVDNSPSPLPDANSISELPAIIAQLEDHVLEDGEMSWVLLEASGAQTPMFARKLARTRSVLSPNFDTHVAAVVPFDANDDGLPSEAMTQELGELEDEIISAIGDGGRLVVAETGGGERTLHFYVDSTSAALDEIRRACETWDHGVVDVSYESDPGWAAVRHFG